MACVFSPLGDCRRSMGFDTGECSGEVSTPAGTRPGNVLVVTPDAHRVVVDNHASVGVYNFETGNGVHISRGECPLDNPAGYLSADGKHLLVTHDNGLSEIFDLERGERLAEFLGEGNGGRSDAIICENTVMYVDKTGRADFLAMENVTPGAPVITAWRECPLNKRSVRLPHCSPGPKCPRPTVAAELPCPQCGKPVKLNPFVIEADGGRWRRRGGEKVAHPAPPQNR